VVENDATLRQSFVHTLTRYGYSVVAVSTGYEALQVFAITPVDLVVIEVQLPTMDGFAVCADIRKRSDVPIVMVSADISTDSLVTGLRMGADGYLPSPFTPMEMLARVHALLRRVELNRLARHSKVLVFNDIILNEVTREVTVAGELVKLTPTEYELLRYLMQNPERTVTTHELLNHVWNCDYFNDMNFVRVTMCRLRLKIETKREDRYLRTIHGRGYMLSSSNRSK
jgi:DNA-binding response OmpR family regulator